MKAFGWILAGSAALLLAGAALRKGSAPESAPRPRKPVDVAIAKTEPPPAEPGRTEAPLRSVEQEPAAAAEAVLRPLSDAEFPDDDFWTEVGRLLESRETADPEVHRAAVIRKTAEFLRMSPEEERAFAFAARTAREHVHSAWTTREESWITVSSNIGLYPQAQERVEQQIQERYEREKQSALERLGMALGEGELRFRLRERLEEWFDAVR